LIDSLEPNLGTHEASIHPETLKYSCQDYDKVINTNTKGTLAMSELVWPVSLEDVAEELLNYGFEDVKQLGAGPFEGAIVARVSICLNEFVAIKLIKRGPKVSSLVAEDHY
jgi:hypothetical protein